MVSRLPETDKWQGRLAGMKSNGIHWSILVCSCGESQIPDDLIQPMYAS
jgi:hypothetical protein